MNKSNTIQKLADAMTKAQAEMPIVRMNALNPFFKNKYADLGAVIEASRGVLAKNGLSISQFPTSGEGVIGVTSILMHSSGEWLEETILIPSSDNKGLSVAQSVGVAISYLRRYSWASILGLYAEEDMEGNQPGRKSQPAKVTAPPNPKLAAPEKDSRVWNVAQKEALIKAGLAKNDFAAKGMLGLSNLPVEATNSEIIEWGKIYQENRRYTDENGKQREKMSADEAAKIANGEAAPV